MGFADANAWFKLCPTVCPTTTRVKSSAALRST